jgi:hypothetical protein
MGGSADVTWLLDSLNKALQLLDANDPKPAMGYAELGCETLLSLPARRVLAACERAWLFGGAGSWNDVSVGPDAAQEFQRVSNDLYRVLMDAACEAANSCFS